MRSAIVAKNYGHTTFITGMRAYAAMAVMLTHSGGAGLRELGVLGQNLTELGAQGVSVFFVISGFSVASSCEGSNFAAYFIKRLARITPLYYAWLLAACLLSADAVEWQQRYGTSVNGYNICMHLSFLSWLDYRIACTILGVEWSIPVEVAWYLVIPFLLRWMSTPPRIIAASLAGLVWLFLVISARPLLPISTADAAFAIHWSPLPYAIGFIMGIAAYRIRQWWPTNTVLGTASVVIAPLLIIAWSSVVKMQPHAITYLFFTCLTFGLITFGDQGSALFRGVFCNRIVLFLGTISYGLYLSHMPLLRILVKTRLFEDVHPFAAFAAMAICCMVVSAATHVLIERPFGRFFEKAVSG